jgi:hypothetical protein
MPLGSSFFSSDCSILEVGCYLKIWNGSSWVNADDYTNVVDGKLSDGTYCYTVVDGIITSKALCTVDVYLNICSDTTADGSGYVSVRAQAQDSSSYAGGNLITLNTSVTIDFVIDGADSGQITESITIPGGSSTYGSVGFGPGFGIGESVSNLTITGLTYSSGSAGNQVYITGSTNIGSC